MQTQISANDRPHKRLEAWKQSMDLVTLIYRRTQAFPRDEEFGLRSQLRRAAVSVPSNIAEGLTRRTRTDKLHFLNIAQASLSEIDTQLDISRRLDYIDDDSFRQAEKNLTSDQRLLSGLIRKILS